LGKRRKRKLERKIKQRAEARERRNNYVENNNQKGGELCLNITIPMLRLSK